MANAGMAPAPAQCRKRQPPQPMTTAALPRPFQTLAGANLAAQAGQQVSPAKVPIVAVLALTAGPARSAC